MERPPTRTNVNEVARQVGNLTVNQPSSLYSSDLFRWSTCW